MANHEYRETYRRRLPHIHPAGSTFFVTFRLSGSLPKSEIHRYLQQKRAHEYRFERIVKLESDHSILQKARNELRDFERAWFVKFEEIVDAAMHGPKWLSIPEVREAAAIEMRRGDGRDYKLYTYCIMSNHIHLVLRPRMPSGDSKDMANSEQAQGLDTPKSLPEIMKSIKGASARTANKLLGRSGSFWDRESYDRYIRSEEEFFRVVRYTIRNPVKARLTNNWKNWNGTYLIEELRGRFSAL